MEGKSYTEEEFQEFLEQYAPKTAQPVKNMAALEAIEYNIFSEYNALRKMLEYIDEHEKDYNKNSKKYKLGRFLVLGYMIKCVKADPDNGDWYNEDNLNDLKRAGQLLYEFEFDG